jgi:hypothetical protein
MKSSSAWPARRHVFAAERRAREPPPQQRLRATAKRKPIGSTRWLAAVRSLAPVVRAAVLVGDSNKIDVVLPDTIDDAVRKAGNDPLAKATGKWRTRLGAGGNTLRGLLNCGKKAEAESIEARLIELH